MSERERVYIAGPMTGRPRYNLAPFEAARDRYISVGDEVVIPHDCSSRVWQRHFGRDFDFDCDTCEYGDPLIGEMFAEDIAEVTRADMVAVLPDWMYSRGARIEVLTAFLLGKRVVAAESGEPISDRRAINLVSIGLHEQLCALQGGYAAQEQSA